MANTPTETLVEYVRAFESLDTAAFVPYYNIPCLFMTPVGVTAVTNATEAQAVASHLVTQARQQDYKRTEFLGPIDCRMLSPILAVLSGVFRRLNTADQVILEFGFMYVMQQGDTAWKIAFVAAYECPRRAS